MCKKCDTPEVPALLAKFLAVKEFEGNKGVRAFHISTLIGSNLKPSSHIHWHNNDTYAIRRKGDDIIRGHAMGTARAIMLKQANRTPTTVLELEPFMGYLNYIGRMPNDTLTKIEPNMASAWAKLNKGDWERINFEELLPININDKFASASAFRSMNRLHNLHISVDNPAQVAYYPTVRHMREGREVRTKLGKYLNNYASVFCLTESDIKNMAEKHSANLASRNGWTVGFIEKDDPDGWVRTYSSDKVTSCMAGEKAVRVYANEHSVVRLAYVFDGNEVVARCIVRDGSDDDGGVNGYIRVYPDANGYAEGRFLLDYLKANGYENQTNLDGVILQAIPHGSTYVCPYLDSGNNGEQNVGTLTINGTWFLRVGDGEYEATNTNGYAEDGNQCECTACGDSGTEDDMTYIESADGHVCDDCRENDYTYAYGHRYEEYFPADDCVCVGDNYYLIDTLAYHDIFWCEESEQYLHGDDMEHTTRGFIDRELCTNLDHADKDGHEYAHDNDVAELSDGTKCHEDDQERLQAEMDFDNNETTGEL